MILEHLLSAWPKVVKQLKDARHILLLTDYDGTLIPIVDKPEMANLSEDMKGLLLSLAHQRHFTLGIISGRALVDLKDRVGIGGIFYVGNHGLEIEGPRISYVNPVGNRFKPILHVIHLVLSKALGTIRGVFVENKGLSLSIHYRLAEECKAREIEKIMKQVTGSAEAAGQAKITSGKKVYEVRPAVTWNKGNAVKLIMKQCGKGGRNSGLLPIYLGDDLTDEDGFRIIENYGNSISIFVGDGEQQSTASYFLKSPEEVAAFLNMLIRTCQ